MSPEKLSQELDNREKIYTLTANALKRHAAYTPFENTCKNASILGGAESDCHLRLHLGRQRQPSAYKLLTLGENHYHVPKCT